MVKKPLITEIDNVETKRVLTAINKERALWNAIFIPIAVLVMAFAVPYLSGSQYESVIYIALAVLIIGYFSGNTAINNKYGYMLEVAKMNDKIRHEEKVRYQERDKYDLEKEIEHLKRDLEEAKSQRKDLL